MTDITECKIYTNLVVPHTTIVIAEYTVLLLRMRDIPGSSPQTVYSECLT